MFIIQLSPTAPASPNAPISLDSSDIQYNKATIQWTVSILAYTPEQYTVIYGTSESSLTNTSMVVNGGNDFDSLNDEYQVTITDLVFSTVYYYSVRATNTEGSTDSVIQMFKTKERRELHVHVIVHVHVHCMCKPI